MSPSPGDQSVLWLPATSHLSWPHIEGDGRDASSCHCGVPRRTWQLLPSSAPWPVSVGENGGVRGARSTVAGSSSWLSPACPCIPPHNLSAHLGSCRAMEAPPAPHHWPQPTHEDAQQDDVPGEASPADGMGRGELVTAAMWCPPSPIPWGYPQAGTTFPDPNTHTATLWRSQPLPTHRGPWQQASTR